MLHDPVLAGMITDDRQRAARREGVAEGREHRVEPFEFSVDGNPERLEEPGELPGAARAETADCPDEIVVTTNGR
jgi:hypothetical protein